MPRAITKRSDITLKARQLLAFAEERAKQTANWVELHNALFGLGGRATGTLTTESVRRASARSDGWRRVVAPLDTLPPPCVKGFGGVLATADGAISVRFPGPYTRLCWQKQRPKA